MRIQGKSIGQLYSSGRQSETSLGKISGHVLNTNNSEISIHILMEVDSVRSEDWRENKEVMVDILDLASY